MPWYASLTSPREAPLRPLSFIPTFWPLYKYPPTNTVWLRFGTPLQIESQSTVEKLPKSRRYRLCPQGYSICLVFLKLFERVYSPLTAALLQPYRADSKLQQHKRTQLDRLYQKIVDDLDELLGALGLKAA